MIPHGPHKPPDFIAELKDSRTVFLGVFILDEDGEIVTGTKEMTKEEVKEADDFDFMVSWNNDPDHQS